MASTITASAATVSIAKIIMAEMVNGNNTISQFQSMYPVIFAMTKMIEINPQNPIELLFSISLSIRTV